MLSLLAVFLGMVYRYLRREDWRPVDALSLLLLFGFSTLTFYTYSFPGYTDSLTYVLLTLAWFAPKKHGLRVLLLALLIFNHEQTIFLFRSCSFAGDRKAGRQTTGSNTRAGSYWHWFLISSIARSCTVFHRSSIR